MQRFAIMQVKLNQLPFAPCFLRHFFQLVLGVQQVVVGEAMLLGQKLGLDPAILAGVINSSTGGCWASSVNNPVPFALPEKSPPCERDYEGGFATALMLKVGPLFRLSQLHDLWCYCRTWGLPRILRMKREVLCHLVKQRKTFMHKSLSNSQPSHVKIFRLSIVFCKSPRKKERKSN